MMDRETQEKKELEKLFIAELKEFRNIVSSIQHTIEKDLMEKCNIFYNKIAMAYSRAGNNKQLSFYLSKIREANLILPRRNDADFIKNELSRLKREATELLNIPINSDINSYTFVQIITALGAIGSIALLIIKATISTLSIAAVATYAPAACIMAGGFLFFRNRKQIANNKLVSNNIDDIKPCLKTLV